LPRPALLTRGAARLPVFTPWHLGRRREPPRARGARRPGRPWPGHAGGGL